MHGHHGWMPQWSDPPKGPCHWLLLIIKGGTTLECWPLSTAPISLHSVGSSGTNMTSLPPVTASESAGWELVNKQNKSISGCSHLLCAACRPGLPFEANHNETICTALPGQVSYTDFELVPAECQVCDCIMLKRAFSWPNAFSCPRRWTWCKYFELHNTSCVRT